MHRWGILLAGGLLALALVGPARAQAVRNVPIDTTKNLAAPIPLIPVAPKKSLVSRTVNTVKSVVPFVKKSTPQIAPVAPTTQLPNPIKPAIADAISSVTSMLHKPRVSDFVTGSAK